MLAARFFILQLLCTKSTSIYRGLIQRSASKWIGIVYTMAAPNKNSKAQPRSDEDCTLPVAPTPEVLRKYVLTQNEEEEQEIASYVEWQAKEAVHFLEKNKTERVLGRDVNVWDVRTDKNRYWVLTSPTN